MGEPADPFNTPLEILPEWYFFPTFNLLRVLPNKFRCISYGSSSAGLITVPFMKINKFQNRSVDHLQVSHLFWFFVGSLVRWACLPIDKAISLGFW
jgi:cytochrome b6-f complex subunit 4